MIKEAGLSEKDLKDLRESFVMKYSSMKGWDPLNLTNEQMNEIYSQPDYKKPGMLLS